MTSGGVRGVCGAPGEGEALRGARGNRLPGQYPRRPADGGGWVGPCTDALKSAGHKAGEYGGVPPPGEPTPGNCREDGPAAPPDDHRMAQRLQIGSRQGKRAGSYCRRAAAYHTTTVDRLHKGDHPTGYWCGHPESGPRRRPPCGRREIPGHPSGSGGLDLEQRFGKERSDCQRGWRPDHPALRRRERSSDAGGSSLQQHPSRAGGDMRPIADIP